MSVLKKNNVHVLCFGGISVRPSTISFTSYYNISWRNNDLYFVEAMYCEQVKQNQIFCLVHRCPITDFFLSDSDCTDSSSLPQLGFLMMKDVCVHLHNFLSVLQRKITVVTSCLLCWKMRPFQNRVFF